MKKIFITFIVLIALGPHSLIFASEGALVPVLDMLLNEQEPKTERITIYSDQFDSNSSGWSLEFNDGNSNGEINNYALAEISEGILNVFASQMYGTPSAEAYKSIDIPESLSNITLKIDIIYTNTNAEGVALVFFVFDNTQIAFSLDGFNNRTENQTLLVTYRDGVVSGRLDDVSFTEEKFNVKTLEDAEDKPNIKFYSNATGEGAYGNAYIKVDAIEIFTFQ